MFISMYAPHGWRSQHDTRVKRKNGKPLAGRSPQGVERRCCVQDGEPPGGLLLESLERPDKYPLAELFGPFVSGRTVLLNARTTQRAHDRFHEIVEAAPQR
jgi:hypothetical protein